ncbi:DUF2974 domain-containing protein [Rheinheimera maricola]|uniref:DUF2974 domain-containing protein n=1 Tax=Rheinheimera maricola TaxID=2793282 RepID=A0ABS7XE69_9GAMM|nr:DUF2974 domain-containing protein [Rheinheimera maricola]MBZ9613424.1 DUF2974 domain-containing protein [Rheinheimera maricola]
MFGSALQSAYEQATDSATSVFANITQAAESVGQAFKEGVSDVASASQKAARNVATNVVIQVHKAKQSVSKFLGPKAAGEKIQFCPNRSKKERVAYRQNKIAAAQEHAKDMPHGPERAALEKATERFEFNNRAVERARLANDAYGIGQNKPPEGWIRPSADELVDLGLDPQSFPALEPDFNPDENQDGFFVDIYKTDPDVFGEEKYVISYRGTQGKEDWKVNAVQSAGGETEHYSKAMNIARDASKALGAQLEVTGHSLGGGLATAAGIVSGSKTYAFNPAGVHPDTLERMGDFSRNIAMTTIDGKPLVDNVVVPGDPVTGLQNTAMQRAVVAGGIVAGNAIAGPLGVLGASTLAMQNRATSEQGTLTYGMAGKKHIVPFIENSKEVTEATANGKSIQAMVPGPLASIDPRTLLARHSMESVIAGIEQQKTDDLGQLEQHV